MEKLYIRTNNSVLPDAEHPEALFFYFTEKHFHLIIIEGKCL